MSGESDDALDLSRATAGNVWPARCGRLRRRSAVVIDDLDGVPVGVEDKRAVVAGVVEGALAGTAVVLVARGERGGVERPHGRVVLRREREVDVLGERPPVADEREAVVRAGEPHAVGLVVGQAEPGVRGDRRVEAPGDLRVADADPQVVEHPGEATVAGILDARGRGQRSNRAPRTRRERTRPAAEAMTPTT